MSAVGELGGRKTFSMRLGTAFAAMHNLRIASQPGNTSFTVLHQ